MGIRGGAVAVMVAGHVVFIASISVYFWPLIVYQWVDLYQLLCPHMVWTKNG